MLPVSDLGGFLEDPFLVGDYTSYVILIDIDPEDRVRVMEIFVLIVSLVPLALF